MGSAESRVYLVHVATGAALVKRKSGDCRCDVEPWEDVQKSNDGMWKVECYGLDSEKRPNLVYIRNDHHPQRALNATGQLVDCSLRASRDDELWHVLYPDNRPPNTFVLKNKQSRNYLAIRSNAQGNYEISICYEDGSGVPPPVCYWFANLAKYAPSPGQVATLAALTPVAAIGAAIAGGVGGAAIAGALGWGKTTMLSVGATAGGLAVIGKAIHDVAVNPASQDWVVNKM